MKVVANGARPNIWCIPFDPEGIDNTGNGIRQIYGLMEKEPDMFNYTKPVAETAILSSTLTRRFYAKGCEPFEYPYTVDENAQRLRDEFDGMFLLSLRTHKLQTFILDKDLEYENLKNYKVVILPNTGSISERSCAEISKYVEAGGSLIATFETSLYDEKGRKRKDFGLSKVFGAEYCGELPPIGELNRLFIGPGYLSLSVDHPFRSGMASLVPAAGRAIEVRQHTAEALGFLQYPGFYYAAPLKDVSSYPGLVFNKYGKGKVIYIPFELGLTYSRKQPLELQSFFDDIMLYLLNDDLAVSTNLPPTSEISLRETRQGDLMIFLINCPADTPGPRESVEPLHDVKVVLRLPGRKRVQTVQRKTPQAEGIMTVDENNNGFVSICISVLHEYEIIKVNGFFSFVEKKLLQ